MEALTAQRLYFTNRNSLCSILKNYSFKRLAKACLRFLSLKEGEVLLFLISERANASFAILRAIVWNIGNFSETWKKRVKVQMSRKVSDDRIEQMMIKKSIELRRFLSGYFPRFKV